MATTVRTDARPDRATPRTLREALREHPAGPEVVAALKALADRPPPAGWDRWPPAARERYLDAVLDEAKAGAHAGVTA